MRKGLLAFFLSWETIKRASLFTGKVIGRLLPWKNRSGIFFFFPFYQVGGAERIHADIVKCVSDTGPWVFFTNKSKDEKFKPLFAAHARVVEISSLTIGSIPYYILIGALSALINRHARPRVFGSNSPLFYHLLPYLKREVSRIDLLHAFGGDIEHVSLPFVPQIDTRVIYSSMVYADLKAQYSVAEVADGFLSRIKSLDNQVLIPDDYPEKRGGDEAAPLRAVYVGRGALEKRIHLIGRAAHLCQERDIPARFIFVGEVEGFVEREHREACIFKGEVAESETLKRLYDEADVLILTSSREGFPVVIMEAMAHAVVPISTDVGGIPDHVRHGINGILIRNAEAEDEVVDALVEAVGRLALDRTLLSRLSRNAYEHARQHFAPSRFCAAYRQLLLGEKGGAQMPVGQVAEVTDLNESKKD
jgi:glycosyltransferase involved in cell wall biosynthesis